MSIKKKIFEHKRIVALILAIAFYVIFFFVVEKYIPRKMLVLLALVLSLVFGIVTALLCIRSKALNRFRTAIPFGLGVLITFLYLCYSGFDYKFTSKALFPFWLLSLVVALGVSAFVTVKFFWKNTRVLARIGYFLFVVVIVYLVMTVYVHHLNYVLDFNEPKRSSAIIEEKYVDINITNGPNSHKFKINLDGQTFYLKVTKSEYYSYEVGNKYTLYKYVGAFGEEFYISEANRK